MAERGAVAPEVVVALVEGVDLEKGAGLVLPHLGEVAAKTVGSGEGMKVARWVAGMEGHTVAGPAVDPEEVVGSGASLLAAAVVARMERSVAALKG